MKKYACLILALVMLCASGAVWAEETGWDMSVPTEVTEEVRALFDKATEGLLGVSYEPVCVLGAREGAWCILCRAIQIYPGAEPYNVLLYVDGSGIRNIYELWIDRHAEREPAPAGSEPETEQETEEAAAGSDIQYVLYLGTNDKDTNKPVFTEAEAREKAREILIRHFGGYTMQEASGGRVDGGTLFQEYTLVIYLSDTTEEAVHAAADELIETFRQSSVLIQANPTRTEFYAAS